MIDHVGVAVEDIDAALALYRDALGMPLVHRETVAEQGVDAALLDVGDGHVELLAAARAGDAGGQVPGPQGPRPPSCRLSSGRRRGRARRARGSRAALDRRAAAHRHPRLTRGVPPPCVDGRRADRDRATSGGITDMADERPQKISIGFIGGQVLSARVAPRAAGQAAKRARLDGLARPDRRGRHGGARPRQDRLRARRRRRAPGRVRDLNRGLDPRRRARPSVLVFARTAGTAPRASGPSSAYSQLGEHAACWLALGVGGAFSTATPDARRAWLRGAAVVAASYGAQPGAQVRSSAGGVPSCPSCRR